MTFRLAFVLLAWAALIWAAQVGRLNVWTVAPLGVALGVFAAGCRRPR